MLMKKERIKPDMPPRDFLKDVIAANRMRVLPITPEIAWLANFNPEFTHGDPADRIIAATAIQYKIPLITIDTVLRSIKGVTTIWYLEHSTSVTRIPHQPLRVGLFFTSPQPDCAQPGRSPCRGRRLPVPHCRKLYITKK